MDEQGQYRVGEWRDIPGYEGLYQVSDDGRVHSIRRGHDRVLNLMTTGYLAVNLYKHNKSTRFRVHRLVMLVFVGDCPPDHVVDHINGVRLDNRLCNLRYLHHSLNSRQGALLNKLRPIEGNFESKLNPDLRHEIRQLHAGGQAMRSLARQFGVNPASIRRVIYPKQYKHPRSSLSVSDVIEIKTSLAEGVQGVVIAKRFGVSKMAISRIKTGQSWKKVSVENLQ